MIITRPDRLPRLSVGARLMLWAPLAICGVLLNLRASKERCPECGTAIPSPPAEGATA